MPKESTARDEGLLVGAVPQSKLGECDNEILERVTPHQCHGMTTLHPIVCHGPATALNRLMAREGAVSRRRRRAPDGESRASLDGTVCQRSVATVQFMPGRGFKEFEKTRT